jgi:hypothetical protein
MPYPLPTTRPSEVPSPRPTDHPTKLPEPAPTAVPTPTPTDHPTPVPTPRPYVGRLTLGFSYMYGSSYFANVEISGSIASPSPAPTHS